MTATNGAERRVINLAGQRFGRWSVLGRAARPDGKGTGAYWHCVCDCGAESVHRGAELRSPEGTRSCGCLRDEVSREIHVTHGQSRRGSPHRREWTIWCHVVQRTTNPTCADFPDYGGRGIGIAPSWRSFERFLADMGPMPQDKHSIERLRNDEGYSSTNCVWATWTEQARNRRSTRRVRVGGNEMSLVEAHERFGLVSYRTAQNRLNRGWEPDRALTEPVR